MDAPEEKEGGGMGGGGEGEVKGRGMNELYHITCNSQQWLRNLKIQGFINHPA